MMFDEFTKGEKEEWKKEVTIKSRDVTNIKEMARFLIEFVSKSRGKSHKFSDGLRSKVISYTAGFEVGKVNEIINRSFGFGIDVDLRNMINKNIDEIWNLYHYFSSGEDDEGLDALMGGL